MSFSDGYIGARIGQGGGSGVTEYATIAELVTASEGSLAPGYYAATVPATHPEFPQVITYWDGADFLPRPLSKIEDLFDSLAFWLCQAGTKANDTSHSTLSTDPSALGLARSWAPHLASLPYATADAAHTLVGTMGGSLRLPGGSRFELAEGISNPYNITGPMEVFCVFRLDALGNSGSNKGLISKWVSGGWVLGVQDFLSPFGVWFGTTGNYARGAARIDNDPHIIHGRYTGTHHVVSVDGVDLSSVSVGTVTTTTGAPINIGRYDAASGQPVGELAESMLINRALTTAERALVVADMARRAGIVLP